MAENSFESSPRGLPEKSSSAATGDVTDILRDWSVRRSADPEHLRRLKQRILQAADREHRRTPTSSRNGVQAAVGRGQCENAPGGAGVIVAAATAAVLFLAVSVPRITTHHLSTRDGVRQSASGIVSNAPGNPDSLPAYATVPESRRREQAQLLHELRNMFGTRLTWLADFPERLELGIQSEDRPARERAVAVRLVIEQRGVGEKAGRALQDRRMQWVPVCIVDVVMHSDEYVAFQPQCVTGGVIAMWSHVLPDGEVAVETDVTLNTPSRKPLAASDVFVDDRPHLLSQEVIDGVEFRILQSVHVVNDLGQDRVG